MADVWETILTATDLANETTNDNEAKELVQQLARGNNTEKVQAYRVHTTGYSSL